MADPTWTMTVEERHVRPKNLIGEILQQPCEELVLEETYSCDHVIKHNVDNASADDVYQQFPTWILQHLRNPKKDFCINHEIDCSQDSLFYHHDQRTTVFRGLEHGLHTAFLLSVP